MAEGIFIEGLYSLSGKVALVTGGGTWIGRAMAEAIAKAEIEFIHERNRILVFHRKHLHLSFS